MKGKSTWISNSVEWVRWDGDNLEEIKELISNRHALYLSVDGEKDLHINEIGTLQVGSYLTKSHRNLMYTDFYQIYSWKMFPRMINEDIGTGLL